MLASVEALMTRGPLQGLQPLRLAGRGSFLSRKLPLLPSASGPGRPLLIKARPSEGPCLLPRSAPGGQGSHLGPEGIQARGLEWDQQRVASSRSSSMSMSSRASSVSMSRRGPSVSMTNRGSSRGSRLVVGAVSGESSGKRAPREIRLVDPSTAKVMADEDMVRRKKAAWVQRQREIEAINGAWAVLGITAALIGEGLTGEGPLGQIAIYLNYVALFLEKLETKL